MTASHPRIVRHRYAAHSNWKIKSKVARGIVFIAGYWTVISIPAQKHQSRLAIPCIQKKVPRFILLTHVANIGVDEFLKTLPRGKDMPHRRLSPCLIGSSRPNSSFCNSADSESSGDRRPHDSARIFSLQEGLGKSKKVRLERVVQCSAVRKIEEHAFADF